MKFKTFGNVSGDGSGEESKLTRRRFVRGGVAFGAAGSLLLKTSKSALGQEATPEGVIRCGIIGYGDQGKALRDSAWYLKDKVRFPAVADIWERNRRAGVGQISHIGQGVGEDGKTCTGYEDVEKMLAAEDLDAVIVATPPCFHRRYTEMAMDAGLHVYCEKPMSNSIAGARAMVLAQRRTGKQLQIGHQRRSNPRYIHAREEIVHGAKLLGWLTHAEAQWNRSYGGSIPRQILSGRYRLSDEALSSFGYQKGEQGNYEFRNWRFFRKFGAGAVADLAFHQVDVFNWFFDAVPKSVQASGGVDYFDSSYMRDRTLSEIDEAAKKTKSSKRRAVLKAEKAQALAITKWRDDTVPDNVMAVFEYETPRERWGTEGGEGNSLISRAQYKCLSTNGSQKNYEKFIGEFGSLVISELAKSCQISTEARCDHNRWRKALEGESPLLSDGGWKIGGAIMDDGNLADPFRPPKATKYRVESWPLPYFLPKHVQFNERAHTPHLRNFFETVANGGRQEDLNCPAEEAFKTLVSVLKIEVAIIRRGAVDFSDEDFVVG